ncbi:MAG TPA: hypothetical protein VMH87_18245 [Pseudomonadales bacterium]|nr:hypothetical protein [Pseudomonadales bacterium]
MNKKLLKISLLTLVTVAITSLSLISRADDTTAPAADKPAKSKFSGSVTAVDASAKTFTVDGQTYTVTDGSKISRNGKSATLADVVVGDPVKGSYTTGADGKLDVTKVGFGKKMGGKHKQSDASTNAPAATPPN